MSDSEILASGVDLAGELRAGMAAIARPAAEGTPSMSETSIDGTLLLDTIGLEPADFVFGLGARSFPYGMWIGGKNRADIAQASQVLEGVIADAVKGARTQAAAVGARGIVGLQMRTTLRLHYVTVEVKGTAVRDATSRKADDREIFVTDLSARDLVLLDDAGWAPVDFVYGTCFAIVRYQPRVKYTENIEMENMTQALYLAREDSVEKMQHRAMASKAGGVMGTSISEELHGMLTYRVLGFRATGTSVRRIRKTSAVNPPTFSVSMDEDARVFDVAALRGSSTNLLAYRDPSAEQDRAFDDSASSRVWRTLRLSR